MGEMVRQIGNGEGRGEIGRGRVNWGEWDKGRDVGLRKGRDV